MHFGQPYGRLGIILLLPLIEATPPTVSRSHFAAKNATIGALFLPRTLAHA